MTVIDRLLAHNTYATRALIERCRGLTHSQMGHSFDVGPGSTHDTLRHIVGGMFRWADRIGDRPSRPLLSDVSHTYTVDELLEALEQASLDLEEAAGKVVEEGRLDEIMEITIAGYPEPFRFTRGTAIVHIVTHGVHHRAQVLNMLRRLGETDLPDLDAIEWEIGEGAVGS